MSRRIKIDIEKHADGYVGYPLGLKGVLVGQRGSLEEAIQEGSLGSLFSSGYARLKGSRRC